MPIPEESLVATTWTLRTRFNALVDSYQPIVTGVLFCLLLAFAALWLGSRIGVPPLLLALIFGMALRGMAGASRPAIDFASKRLVELGVALLGFKVSIAVLPAAGLAALAFWRSELSRP